MMTLWPSKALPSYCSLRLPGRRFLLDGLLLSRADGAGNRHGGPRAAMGKVSVEVEAMTMGSLAICRSLFEVNLDRLSDPAAT